MPPHPHPDFSHAKLSLANCSGVDMKGARLEHADLRGSLLNSADFSGSTMTKVSTATQLQPYIF